jgi:hypothetical protein
VQADIELDQEAAPDFELRTLTGRPDVWLSRWRGRPLLLVFVQPDCQYSRAILAALAALDPDTQGAQQETVVISLGREAENKRLVAEFGITTPWLLQDDLEVASRFGITGTPASLLVGRDGQSARPIHRGAAGVLTHLGVTPAHPLLRGEWGTRITPYLSVNHRMKALLEESRQRHATSYPGEPFEMSQTDLAGVGPGSPSVSVILTTRNRPALLPIALECYRRQTYARRELLVVDDGDRFPADDSQVAAVGGRVIRAPAETTQAAKLNRGAQEARGMLCHRWDDDDWYAPRFLETLVAAHARRAALTGGSAFAYLTAQLVFDLARWRFVPWDDDDPCAATLIFEREQWARAPFLDVRRWDDNWFLVDELEGGVVPAPVPGGDLYAIVRHDTLDVGKGHVWQNFAGLSMEEYVRRLRRGVRDPSDVLPDWAQARYRAVLDWPPGESPDSQT